MNNKQKSITIKFVDSETNSLVSIKYNYENNKAVLVSSKCNQVDAINSPSILEDKLINLDVFYPKCESVVLASAAIFNEFSFFDAAKLVTPLTKEVYNYLTTTDIKMIKDDIHLELEGF